MNTVSELEMTNPFIKNLKQTSKHINKNKLVTNAFLNKIYCARKKE